MLVYSVAIYNNTTVYRVAIYNNTTFYRVAIYTNTTYCTVAIYAGTTFYRGAIYANTTFTALCNLYQSHLLYSLPSPPPHIAFFGQERYDQKLAAVHKDEADLPDLTFTWRVSVVGGHSSSKLEGSIMSGRTIGQLKHLRIRIYPSGHLCGCCGGFRYQPMLHASPFKTIAAAVSRIFKQLSLSEILPS